VSDQGTGSWHPDPAGRHELRWWDGHGWTDQVSDHGEVATDALPPAGSRPAWIIPAIVVGAVIILCGVLGTIGALLDDSEQIASQSATTTTLTATSTPATLAPVETVPPSTTVPPTTAAPTTVPPAPPTTSPPATAAPVREPAPINLSGRGQTATQTFTIQGGLVTLAASHQGSSNFAVHFVASSGRETLMVNEIGNYAGVTATDLAAGTYLLKILADGPWTAKIGQPRAAQGGALPASTKGTGDVVWGPLELTGTTRFALTHSGSSNFIVYVYAQDGGRRLLVNEIGPYEGSTVVTQSGARWVAIRADGAWTAAVQKP